MTLVIAATSSLFAADEAEISVGVAQIDITPDYPIRLSGFGSRRTESEGVNLKIWAKALAVEDKKLGPAIVITVDNVGIPDDITTEVALRLSKKIGLKQERLSISATHTHTAPMLRNVCTTLFGTDIPADHQERIDRYTREFIDYLEKVALAAFEDIKPAQLYWGTGMVNFAVNRRTSGGPVDHDLPMLAVKDLDGKIRGVYFSYACHCVTLSDNKISGDWAGYAQKRIQELYPDSIALASVGCGADSNPSSGVTGANLKVADDQGKQIADEVKRLVEGPLTRITSKPDIRYTRIDLPFAPPRTRAEWEARAKRDDAIGYHARVNLARLDRGEAIPTKLNYAIQTWVFGDQLAIVFLPGETVVDYSLRLKREFDRSRLWVNGYSNDSRCYIPSERILKEGGYEGGEAQIYYDAPQYFATGIEKKIIDTVTAQIPVSFKSAPGTEGSRPLSPAEALRSFKVKQGLKVELVAAEPLIQAPVAIDWSADGRLWVIEMNDYPNGLDQNWQPGGQVKVLDDLDGDGKYDKATLFASGLPFPTGITAWGKGVFISAAPDILYAEDTNGDGKADKIEKLFTGFFTDNFQARVNSLNLGLDNWIYGANGLLGGNIQPLKNSLIPSSGKPLDIRNHDFRIHPFKGTFEMVSGLTQQGRVRDDWDNWFGCDNSQLLLNFPVPEHYIRRNPHVPAPSPIRNLTARPDGNRLFPISRLQERFNDPDQANRATSACGLGIYRDTLLGDEFYGNAFTCEPVHNLVHREVMEQNLAFTSRRAPEEQQSEFMSSTDNWFRPVQARSGPDGALYIVDMYRFLIEHPRWIPAARLAQIDIRAGADKGRIYRLVKEGAPLRPIRDLTKMNGAELAAALEVPNGIDRDRVHAELLLRKDKSSLPKLKELANSAKLPEVRVQALAVLDGISGLEVDVVQARLKDGEPRIRQHAIRLSEPFLKRGKSDATRLLDSLLAMTNDSSLIVVRQLAFTLGESPDPQAGKALAQLATKWISNAEIRTAILSSSTRHADAILSAVVNAEGQGNEWISPLIATLVNSNDRQSIARAVELALPAKAESMNAESLALLAGLLDSLEQKKANLNEIFANGSTNRKRLDETIAAAMNIAQNTEAPGKARQSALSLIGRGNSEAEATLLLSLARSGSEEIRRAAIASLRRQRNPAVARAALKDWPQTPPTARNEIVSLLLDREEWTEALLQAVKQGTVRPHEISLTDRQRLATTSNQAIQKLASEALPAQSTTGREEVLAQYRSIGSLQGNIPRGAEIFEKNCAACHALNGAGHNVGPDLAALRSKDPEYWVKNILDPNAVVEPRFVNYQVELEDDRSLSGVIRGETANSLTIINGSGASETILRAQVKDIRASSLSLMPEGLEQGINVQQMADLVAFLKSGNPRRIIAGNEPAPMAAASNEVLMLPAATAEIYGKDITFEPQFQNIGMWHGEDDHLVWTAHVARAGKYDVYLDYAAASNSAGNKFALLAGDQTLRGTVAATGADWSNYKQVRIGQVQLAAGSQRITFRPEGPLRGALMDLRTIALAPAGQKPAWPNTEKAPTDQDVLRDPVSVAKFILDPRQSEAARQNAVNANPQFAGLLVTEMTRDLQAGTPEEYARIPWIWRVAIASGKRNDAGQMKAVLDASLPRDNEPLTDWQAVVIGGGIINGISQRDIWPAERIQEILDDNDDLKKRWNRALELSSAMTDNEKVPAGTRYDALRMIAMEPWKKRGEQLVRYLGHSNGELQMGAVSGLVDVNSPEATEALIKALPKLNDGNRELALAGLMRTAERRNALNEALKTGQAEEKWLGEERLKKLKP
ncbi:MAG: neutral/alkaline non-lysosomal ceramidase N-terminal domain-containing protein [Verrucomicrobiales bacterium]